MTEQQHPITPPPELVEQWCNKWTSANGDFGLYLATQAARWGADQELEACCEWLDRNNQWARCDVDELRPARRPKPPSLVKEALLAIDTAVADNRISAEIARVTRAALERLQELEKGNE